ncbi:hypothetical protein D3C80_1918900 [compost metagenome]
MYVNKALVNKTIDVHGSVEAIAHTRHTFGRVEAHMTKMGRYRIALHVSFKLWEVKISLDPQ